MILDRTFYKNILEDAYANKDLTGENKIELKTILAFMEDAPDEDLYLIPESKLKTYLSHKVAAGHYHADLMELLSVFQEIDKLISGKAGISEIMKLAAKPEIMKTYATRINAVGQKYIKEKSTETPLPGGVGGGLQSTTENGK